MVLRSSDEAAQDSEHQDAHAANVLASSFPRNTLVEFETTKLDRVDVPAWCAAAFLEDGSALHGYGFGPTVERARVGALGELIEQYRSRQTVPSLPSTQSSYKSLLGNAKMPSIDPRALSLPAGSQWNDGTHLEWVRASSMTDGKNVLLPLPWIASSPSDLPPEVLQPIVPITNGLGVGLSKQQALTHALLEVLQRDGNGLSIRAFDLGLDVDLSTCSDPVSLELLDRFRDLDIDISVRLASSTFGLPNFCVVGAAPADDVLRATACGEGIHPSKTVALRKALFEFAGARSRKLAMHGPLKDLLSLTPSGYVDRAAAAVRLEDEESRALSEMRAWVSGESTDIWVELEASIFARRGSVAWDRLPEWSGDPRTLLDDLLHRLGSHGFNPLYVDLSSGGVKAMKVVVPGLEVETVAYRRMTMRNWHKLAVRRPDLVSENAGNPGSGWVKVRHVDEARVTKWVDADGLNKAIGSLYPLYREPEDHSVSVSLGL